VHHQHEGVVYQLGVDKDGRGNVKAGTYETSVPGVFAAGDARRGQSLIVWAINEGRQCARMVDRRLKELDRVHRPTVLVGGGDADEGPEGPPQVAAPGL
jgi:glutamate synthase (NADPH/NADH) small chain